MNTGKKKLSAQQRLVLFCAAMFILIPAVSNAAASIPVTQEEIEAILERDQVEEVSSTSLPADLKRRLGQTVTSSTDAIKPAIADTVNRAGQAVATATNILSSTTDKVKENLDNYKTQAQADLNNTFFGRFYSVLSSIWDKFTGWLSVFFRGKPITGATDQL